MIDTVSVSLVKPALAALLVALLSGCATDPRATPESIVKERAESRWKALIAGNYDGAYKLTAPAYRDATSFERYRATIGGAVQWIDAEAVSVTCEPEKCDVRLRVGSKSPLLFKSDLVIDTAVDEVWVREGGQWWLSLKP